MLTANRNNLKQRVLERIKRLRKRVILRSDIQELASPRQISRSLQSLVEMGELVKLGYGVYAKATRSPYINKPVIVGGFDNVCKEALDRLGKIWELGSAEKAYNSGSSTQVPARSTIRLKSRFRGKLAYGNRKLLIENNINAR